MNSHWQTYIVACVVLATAIIIAWFGPYANKIVNQGLAGSEGVWINRAEIMALPNSGSAWDRMLKAANSSWGSACLDQNNCTHDVNTLAGALVAVRNNDNNMRNKTIQGLQSAMNSKVSRALELSRGLQTYIIAADIIGYRTPEFERWIRDSINKDITGHSGKGVMGTATNSSNNWGGHARASVAAAAVYLKDEAMMTKLVDAHKTFIGMDAPNTMAYQNTNWHADSKNKAGVNRKGSKIQNVSVSGLLPEDWRRGGEFKWPPTLSDYMWEGMQGYVVTAVILHRSGHLSFDAGDNAIVRSMDMLYGTGEAAFNNPVFKHPAVGDDTWIPWVVNSYAGTKYPTQSANAGKNMGWTDWTHSMPYTERPVPTPTPTPTPTPNQPQPDTTPPSVVISTPIQNSNVSGTVTLTASASDNVSVSGVQFTVDGNNVGSEDTSSPYSINWNTVNIANGVHVVQAIARDSAGNKSTSDPVTVNVTNQVADVTPPTVSITSPRGGATLSGIISVSVTANDNVGVSKVELYVNGVLVDTDFTSPYGFSWDTVETANGSTLLQAVAYDAVGHSGWSSIVDVNVNNSGQISVSPNSLTFTAVSMGATPPAQNVTLANNGNASMQWSAITNQPWCHINPSSGTLNNGRTTGLSVSMNSPSNVGSFTCLIKFESSNASNSGLTLSAVYNVSAAPVPTPTVVPTVPPTSGVPVKLEQTVTASGRLNKSSLELPDWSPRPNELIIVTIVNRGSKAAPYNVRGNGINFTQIHTQVDTQSTQRVTMFRGMSSSVSSGRITFSWDEKDGSFGWAASASRFSGANTSGTNGSGAIDAAATSSVGKSDSTNARVDITTNSQNTIVYSAVSNRNRTVVFPAGYSTAVSNLAGSSGGDNIKLDVGYVRYAAAGPRAITATLKNTASDWTMAAVAIRP